jgi:cyclopropane-fatty-acyl-phospholipid synthase
MCEVGFRHQGLMVFQLQLTRDRQALPLTRDYMYESERSLRQQDGSSVPARRRRRAS